MTRKPGDGALFVNGPIAAAEMNRLLWTPREWKEISDRAGFESALSELERRVNEATNLYLSCWLHVPVIQPVSFKKRLQNWRKITQSVRKLIWKFDASLTKEGANRDRTKVKGINKKYFRKSLSGSLRDIDGHERQLLSIPALGIDIALASVDYALQEVESRKRGLGIELLWDIWVALVLAHFKECNAELKNRHQLFAWLQERVSSQLQMFGEVSSQSARVRLRKPTVYNTPETLTENLGIASSIVGDARSKTLAKMMVQVSSFDRLKRKKHKKLNSLLKKIRQSHARRKSSKSGIR